jgi:hypothetical protein
MLRAILLLSQVMQDLLNARPTGADNFRPVAYSILIDFTIT